MLLHLSACQKKGFQEISVKQKVKRQKQKAVLKQETHQSLRHNTFKLASV